MEQKPMTLVRRQYADETAEAAEAALRENAEHLGLEVQEVTEIDSGLFMAVVVEKGPSK